MCVFRLARVRYYISTRLQFRRIAGACRIHGAIRTPRRRGIFDGCWQVRDVRVRVPRADRKHIFVHPLSPHDIIIITRGIITVTALAVHPSEPPPQPPPSVCTRKRRTIANRKGLTASVGGGFAGPTLSNGYYAKPRRRPWSRTHIRTRGYIYTMCIGCVYIYLQ